MLDRLSTQVFLVSISVAAVAAILTGVLVRNRTIDAFETAVERDLAIDSAIYDQVSQIPFFFSSWQAGQAEIDAIGFQFAERIAITELDGTTILADTDPGEALPAEPATVLVSDPFGTEYDEDLLEQCLEQVDDDLPFPVVGELDLDTQIAVEERLQACLFESQVSPTASALLFLGYSTETLDTGSLSAGSLLLGGGGVLAIAAAGAVLLARRVSEPVEELTLAASKLKAGDLSQRVSASGNGEIAHLSSSFNEMATRLEQTAESRQRLISDVAHELRNPIGVLQGNLEAAQDDVLPMDAEMVSNLVAETRHLGQLVRDLQEITLAEGRELQINRVQMDLGEVIDEVVGSYAPLHPGVSLTRTGPPTTVLADRLRVRQVIENLVKNALTHTAPRGQVVVTVDSNVTEATVTVSDDGVGIDPEGVPHVFDRFWRADSSRARTTGGSGLGLSISRAIVEAHGGDIAVRSQAGVGSSFTFTIPVGDPVAQ